MANHLETVLRCLRESAEGCTETRADGSSWKDVYLDNALAAVKKSGVAMSYRAFAGYLSALKKGGWYAPFGDDCFGAVRMND